MLDQGGDVVLQAAWRNVRWQQQDGEPLDLLKVFRDNATGRIDQPVWIARKGGDPLALRLIADRKSDAAAAESRRKSLPSRRRGPADKRKRMAARCRRKPWPRPTGLFWSPHCR